MSVQYESVTVREILNIFRVLKCVAVFKNLIFHNLLRWFYGKNQASILPVP